MSIYSPRQHKPAYTGCLSASTSSNSSFNLKQSEIFLDKKTITKRLQRLMLDVKDLDTKMFLSKTITYIDGNSIIGQGRSIEEIMGTNEKAEGVNAPQDGMNVNASQLEQQAVNQLALNIAKTLPHLNLCPLQLSLCIHQQPIADKQLSDTATSEGFFPKKRHSIHISNPIIEESFTSASTVQCECGLFEALLEMVDRLMKCGMIKTIQEKDGECLEIDDVFVGNVGEEVVGKFAQMEQCMRIQHQTETKYKLEVESLKREVQKLKHTLKTKEALLQKEALIAKESFVIKQALKASESKYKQHTEHIATLTQQLKSLKATNTQLQQHCQTLQSHSLTLQTKRAQTQSKLAHCMRQVQHLKANRELSEQSLSVKLESLQFELQLKDSEISNMKTIMECLEKKTKECEQKHCEFKENDERNKQTVSLTMNSTPNNTTLENQQQIFISHLGHLRRFQLQNALLKEQIILLYERTNAV